MTYKFATPICALALVMSSCATSAEQTDATRPSQCDHSRLFSETVGDVVAGPLGEPVWTSLSDEETYSSPRAADLNADGVLDIVQGFGQDTFGDAQSSVVATDGATGARLWRSSGHEDLVGSATFAQLGGDDTIDVVVGGRRGVLLGIDGATGTVLWSFDDQNGRWFNFYTSQIVADQNDDGVVDVLAANGGLVFDGPEEGEGLLLDTEDRKLGYMFLISGADGSVVASVPVPDGGESYMSALILDAEHDDEPIVLLGTGGETLPGSLWRVPLSSLFNDRLADAEVVVSGGAKGVIATPGLAMLTDDCAVDIVNQSFDGTITAIDGLTNETLWKVTNSGYETYSSPTLGYFVGDDQVPDVFASVARGVWPVYESSDYLVIDGKTGEVTWRQTLGTFGPSGFVAVDTNGDGRDEVIFGVNLVGSNTHQLYLLDTTRNQAHRLGEPLSQTTFAAPWVGDLDHDGRLDLIVTASAYQTSGTAVVQRFALRYRTAPDVSWGSYLGTAGDGRLR